MRIDEVPWFPVFSCSPDTTLSEVARMLDRRDCEGIMLVEASLIVGCFVRDDLNNPLISAAKAWNLLSVGPYAHSCHAFASPGTDLAAAWNMVRIRNLPILAVKQDGKIAGIVTRTQLQPLR